MKVMVIYFSRSKRFSAIAETIFAGFQSKAHQAELAKADENVRAVSLFPYDLVLVGCPVEGFWGSRFPKELDSFIGRCTGFQGKKTAVFVYPKSIRTAKALKRIMHRLEEKGSIVIDFRRLKTKNEAKAFAEKFAKTS